MSIRSGASVLAIMIMLLPGDSMARDLAAAERRSLETSVREFDRAMRSQNFEAVIGKSLSPRMLSHLARGAGVDVAKLRAGVIDTMAKTMETVKLESFAMELARSERRELRNGTPFMLIPTEVVMNLGSQGRVRARSQTLGLLDEGTWYLVRVASPQELTLLQEVYPDFAGVELPRGTMETLK